MPLRPQSLHELLDMCLGGFYVLHLTSWGVCGGVLSSSSRSIQRPENVFFQATDRSNLRTKTFFLAPERRLVKFPSKFCFESNSCCSRNTKRWMGIVRHADRQIAESGPSEGVGASCLPPDPPFDPSSLPGVHRSVDTKVVMRRSRRRQAAGGPPVVFLLQFAHHAAR